MAQPTPDVARFLMPNRDAEVALARSAAATSVSAAATVLVLGRRGFVEAARGKNGFTCVVLRSFNGRIGDPDFWNARVRAPHCFNAPAARTVLVESLKRAEWVLDGVSEADIAARTRRAYATREFPVPADGAMAYMQSRAQYLGDTDARWMPHPMFFHDRSLPSATWGAGGAASAVIDGSAGDPDSPVLVLLIPVHRWSDGTPASVERSSAACKGAFR